MYDILTHSSAVLRCQWQSQLKRIVCTFYSDSEKLNSTVTWTLPILGVHVANDLKWTCHVDAITSIISSLLYFLKQLKRSGAEPDDLLCFYTTTICPVAEYACPVWYSSLTAAQTKALESLQRRAMRTKRELNFPDDDYSSSLPLPRSRNARITTGAANWAVLHAECLANIVVSALTTTGQTEPSRHWQTATPPKHLILCWLELKNFASNSYRTA